MRKALLFIFFSLMINVLCCQTVVISKYNTPVNIYKNGVGDSVKYCIMQDTISDRYYNVQILESSPLRFKVLWNYFNDSIHTPNFEGWIDKQDCKLHIRYHYDENHSLYIRLYKDSIWSSTPENLSIDKHKLGKIQIIEYYVDEHYTRWYKVCFYYKNKFYIGWLNR